MTLRPSGAAVMRKAERPTATVLRSGACVHRTGIWPNEERGHTMSIGSMYHSATGQQSPHCIQAIGVGRFKTDYIEAHTVSPRELWNDTLQRKLQETLQTYLLSGEESTLKMTEGEFFDELTAYSNVIIPGVARTDLKAFWRPGTATIRSTAGTTSCSCTPGWSTSGSCCASRRRLSRMKRCAVTPPSPPTSWRCNRRRSPPW
jgi:hypothetical protein